MRTVIHPRPSPIVAAMYTLRDMEVDVIVVHGPSGCSFMASRPLENAGVRGVTTAMRDNDLIFGASEPLINTLKQVEERFHPETVAVIGTCASMIIGEDMASSIRKAGIDANVFPVDVHACMGDNTRGAIKALEAGRDAGIIDADECARQISLMKAATRLEKDSGMASKDYIKPAVSPTKMHVCKRIVEVLSNGGRVAVVMDAKKELAYRFADMFEAVDRARKALGGETLFVANLDGTKSSHDLVDRHALGSEIVGQQMRDAVDAFSPDLTIILGICHAVPGMKADDILITDQPRQLANYLNMGCEWAVGEISSHTMVMGAHSVIPLETADTLREML